LSIKAKDTRFGRFAGLKFLPDDLARDQLALERFRRGVEPLRRKRLAGANPYVDECLAVVMLGCADDKFEGLVDGDIGIRSRRSARSPRPFYGFSQK